MAAGLARFRLHLSLALISAAVISYQLALMQILSLLQWHHFAYLIIAVALMGFGAAGTFLSLLHSRLMRFFPFLLPLLLCLSGASMVLMTGIAQGGWVRFDSLLLFTGVSHLLRLLITCGLYLLPFFLAGLAIGMIFVRGAADIGRLYFWNLTGSGTGGAAMIGLLWIFPPLLLPGPPALEALAASLLVLPDALRGTDGRRGEIQAKHPLSSSEGPGRPEGGGTTGQRGVLCAALLLSILATAFLFLCPPVPVLSEFKGLSRALLLPDARITQERSSPYGFVQVVSSPALRYAPGLSLAWHERLPASRAVFNNGDWYGAIVLRQGEKGDTFLNHTTGALPYVLEERRSVLILDAGTGSLIPQALSLGARQVTAVEPHPAVLSLLRGELAGETGNLLSHPSLKVHNLSSRTFLLLDRSRYDLILLPTVDAFGGTSGLQAGSEQYLLTREAFRQIWRKLTPRGAVSFTCWMDYPLRHPLKLLATLAEALEAEGVGELRSRLVLVRGWGTITILAKKTPLEAADIRNIRRFCRENLFDPALLSDLQAEERMQFNGLQDGRFFLYLDAILSPARARFYADYAFDVRPASDDRPYLSQFLRWRSIPDLVGLYGLRNFPFLEAGYLLVLITLVLVVIIASVLILLPLRLLRRRGGCRMGTLLYFSGLGLGYMFVEIVLIQRFLLYFGNPVQTAAVVISGMLVCSGVGSLLSARRIRTRGHGLALLASIILLLLTYAHFLTPILQAAIAMPPAAKVGFSFLLIAPAALLMGMPFPLGIRLLTGRAQEIPWAWGINGALSVVGTALAAVISVALGFAWVMILAALAYGLTLVGLGLLRPSPPPESMG